MSTRPSYHRAFHATKDGVFVLAGPDVPLAGRVEGASILDVAPTCLALMGVPVPAAMSGRDLRLLHRAR